MTHWPKGKIVDLLSRRRIDLKRDVALVVEVGSTMHGISIDGVDDLDLTVVRFEQWHEFVNGPSQRQSMMIRTQPDGDRSRFGDIDINVYTLRKFAGLAAKGNPSILAVLFAPNRWTGRFHWVDWGKLIAYTTSQAAGAAFLGYMRQQMERWQGKRGQKNVNRPELVERYGFDTKYAGHVVRLGLQGTEYLTTGRITLPMPKEQAADIRNLRTGGFTEPGAMAWALKVENELKAALDASTLPERPNLGGTDMWMADTYAQAFRSMLTVEP